MADLSAQPVPIAGLQPTYAAATGGGDTAPVGTGLLLAVRNDGVSSVTVTVATPGTVGGLTIGEAVVSVPAGEEAFVPLRPVYRDPATGRAAITYSDTTSVDVAVLQLP